ncbi:TIGR00701 family protein [Gammaproteobacteria bacterium 53_120_T64]|nr:TIGR00701 family protein [Gammaproteobacteria bacterium 53_120_T64]
MAREWVLALHIISLVCWFAALFYLPRLFVYHATAADAISDERFKLMERKLYRGIATPAMIATLVFGIWLASFATEHYLAAGWFQTKLALVALLIGYHFTCRQLMRQFQAGLNTHSDKFYRWFNEAPVLLLVAIVVLVVVKPY